ncbi:condensation domain-containing protein [Streptomyces coeruleorubidus]|uniref:condensation domain-containing protein n=1 Tax=Streptomyces coeruleorubidus TaxID=116188 RepID=UPI003665C800
MTLRDPAAPAADHPTLRPLTDAQLGLWLAHQMRPGDTDLHVLRAFRISGPLDRAALARALARVTYRHPPLRSLHPGDGPDGPVRRVRPPSGTPCWHDLGTGSDRELAAFHRRPFDLETEPPVRAGISRPGHDGTTLAAFCFHHIAMDGVSAVVFCLDLADAYRAETSPDGVRATPAPATGRDRAPAPAQAPASRDGDDARSAAYWTDRLAAPPPPLLPAPAGRVPPTGRPARVRELRRGAATVRVLRQTARAAGATPHMVLTAAYAAALGEVFGRDDVILGTPVSLRASGEADLVDCLVTLLPLRVQLAGRDRTALLRQVRERSLEAQRHRAVPAAALARAAGTAVLESPYQAVIDVRHEQPPALPLWGCVTEAVHVEPGSVQYPLDLEARIGDGSLRLVLRTDAATVPALQADAVLAAVGRLLPHPVPWRAAPLDSSGPTSPKGVPA